MRLICPWNSPGKNIGVGCCFLLDHIQFTLIYGYDILGSYAVFFFVYWTLLSPPDISTTECCFRFGPAASFFLELLVIALCSSPVAHWTPSDKRAHLLLSYLLAFWYSSWDSCRRSAGVCCHFLLQWTMFYQHSSLWPICLGWPCMAWLIASAIYTSPFATTRLWSM